MNRRLFFTQLASGLVAASAPGLFLPKLVKPAWKVPFKPKPKRIEYHVIYGHNRALVSTLVNGVCVAREYLPYTWPCNYKMPVWLTSTVVYTSETGWVPTDGNGVVQ